MTCIKTFLVRSIAAVDQKRFPQKFNNLWIWKTIHAWNCFSDFLSCFFQLVCIICKCCNEGPISQRAKIDLNYKSIAVATHSVMSQYKSLWQYWQFASWWILLHYKIGPRFMHESFLRFLRVGACLFLKCCS